MPATPVWLFGLNARRYSISIGCGIVTGVVQRCRLSLAHDDRICEVPVPIRYTNLTRARETRRLCPADLMASRKTLHRYPSFRNSHQEFRESCLPIGSARMVSPTVTPMSVIRYRTCSALNPPCLTKTPEQYSR